MYNEENIKKINCHADVSRVSMAIILYVCSASGLLLILAT